MCCAVVHCRAELQRRCQSPVLLPCAAPTCPDCSPATDVKVTDAAWPEAEFSTAGELTASFDSVPVGTSVRHSYVVTPKLAGVYTHGPVVVTYVAEADAQPSEVQTTTSSQLPFRTYTFGDSVTEQALDWGATLTNGFLVTTTDWTRATYVTGFVLTVVLGWKSYRSYSSAAAGGWVGAGEARSSSWPGLLGSRVEEKGGVGSEPEKAGCLACWQRLQLLPGWWGHASWRCFGSTGVAGCSSCSLWACHRCTSSISLKLSPTSLTIPLPPPPFWRV